MHRIIPRNIDMQELIEIVVTFYNMEGVPKERELTLSSELWTQMVMDLWMKRSSVRDA